ncbi:MAG TPA: GDSL-type esterase/lipase family protein [Bryobacteraceae bacterium]|jgi:lysophospholipase L1-like esterase
MKHQAILLRYLLLFACVSSAFAQNSTTGNSPNSTVFMGDSITSMGNAYETNPSQTYGWGWTAQAVFLSNGRIQQLYNAGTPGNTTAQMLSRFQSDVIAYNPGTVVIMGGTNDATSGSFTTTALAATISNLQQMIEQAKKANIQPILCTIPPRSDAANYNQNVQMINGAIHKLAQSERILLVDFYSILVDPTTGVYKSGYDLGDGIHPSVTADKAMAQFFITATANLFGPTQEYLLQTQTDNTNLIANPLFLLPTTAWSTNGYGTSPAPTYATVTGDSSISGNWLSFTFPPGTAPGQNYSVNGPYATVTAGHHMAYSFKFQISGLEENGGYLNMGYAWGASAFTYGYLTDTTGTFYIEFTAPNGTFVPGFFVYPTVTNSPIVLKIAQMSLVDLTNLGY